MGLIILGSVAACDDSEPPQAQPSRVNCEDVLRPLASFTEETDQDPRAAYYDARLRFHEGLSGVRYAYCDDALSPASGSITYRKDGTSMYRLDLVREVDGRYFELSYLATGDEWFTCSDQLGDYYQARLDGVIHDPTLPEGLREELEDSAEFKLRDVGQACIHDDTIAGLDNPDVVLNDFVLRPFGVPHVATIEEFEQFEPDFYTSPETTMRRGLIAGVPASCFVFRFGATECYADSGELLYSRRESTAVLMAVELLAASASDFRPPLEVKGPTPQPGCRFGYFESPEEACPPTQSPDDLLLADAMLTSADLPGEWALGKATFEPATCGDVFSLYPRIEHSGSAQQLLTRADGLVQVAERAVRVQRDSVAAELASLKQETTTCKNQVGILIGAGLPDPDDVSLADGAFAFRMVHEKLGTKMKVVVFRKDEYIVLVRQVARTQGELDDELLDRAVEAALTRIEAAAAAP